MTGVAIGISLGLPYVAKSGTGQGGSGNFYALTVTPQGASGAPGTTQQLTVTETPSQPMALTVSPNGASGAPGSTQQITTTG